MVIVIITSILISCILSPLGCIVLWKKYIYFADGLAHSSLIIGVLSILLGIPLLCAGIINSIFFAFLVFNLKSKSDNNAVIGFISSTTIAITLILSHFYSQSFNIKNVLFGDIVLSSINDIFLLSLLLLTVILFFIFFYNRLLIIIINADIARVKNINVNLIELLFLCILSFAVLTTIKIVGALLVTSIIIIPAIISRIIAKSPSSMIWASIFFSLVINFIGIILSFFFDIPFTPIIIIVGAILYISILLLDKLSGYKL